MAVLSPRTPRGGHIIPGMYVSQDDDPDGLAYVARVVEVIREEREGRNWTALELAQRSGVHHSVISRAELGERIPGVPVFVRLCRALEIQFSEVCRRVEG